ncbi:hypothetical protein EC12741_B0025 [Escherichia coli 1.2741]|nr:hypothetical protein EC12741_B0025 [Escherichia coli 1.2741]
MSEIKYILVIYIHEINSLSSIFSPDEAVKNDTSEIPFT